MTRLTHPRLPRTLLLLTAIFALTAGAMAQDIEWPKVIEVDNGKVTVYQPEVDSFEGNVIEARAAVAYTETGGEPTFGAAWLKAQVGVDREQRLVTLENIEVTELRSADGEDYREKLDAVLKEHVAGREITTSLDDLIASMHALEEERTHAANLKTDPPQILFRTEPALLVTIDGDTAKHDIDNSPYQAVVNTPYPLLHNKKKHTYHLTPAEGVWYRAKSEDGSWSYDASPPKDAVKLVADAHKDQEAQEADDDGDSEPITAANAPEIVVTHTPTELIVAEGEPEFKPLVDDLLVMTNTESHVFQHVSQQDYYVVLSGRWYKAKSMQGPWTFVAADSLPDAFASIPEDEPSADARVYVAGTPEAKDAVLDAQIPQTATVQRGQVELDVQYDGQAKFEPIDGTELELAVNSSDTVLKAGRDYYCVRDGVWYIARAADGPWEVADHAPPGVADIPPSSPAYNTKYVKVYDSTPEVVYVGYTPGYVGSYIYGPTVVWGTGWYYHPWISPYYYYPWHSTWGFHVSYNSWTGWGFGLSWSSGPFHFGFYSGGYWHHNYPWYGPGYGHGGWWGPGGYRPRFSAGNRINIGNDVNINVNNFNRSLRNTNIYQRPTQRARVQDTRNLQGTANRQAARSRTQSIDRSAARSQAQNLGNNNVFTDKAGNVHRKTADGWQTRDAGQWHDSASRQARPSTGSVSRPTSHSTYDRSHLDRSAASRQRGYSRSQSFHSMGSRGGARGRRR